MKKILLIAIFANLFIISAKEFNIKAAQDFLQGIKAESPIPGFSITINYKGENIYSKGFGVEVYGEEKAFTADSVVGAGQLTSMFTNMAIMNLKIEGKLKLDDSIIKYIPWFKLGDGKEDEITIKMLLTGTSGLPGKWSFIIPGDESDDADKRLGLSLSASFLNREPGSSYELNFEEHVLLGLIIEEITKISYQDYITKNIIEKLGLKSTAIKITEIEALHPLKGHYAGIDRAIPAKATVYDASYVASQSLLHSTSRDIAQFTYNLLNDSRYKEIFRTYSKSSSLSDNTEHGHGMGCDFYTEGGHELISFGANILTSGGAVLVDRENDLIIVLMANLGNQLAKFKYYGYAYIINSLYLTLNNLELNGRFGLEKNNTINGYELAPELLDNYVGIYRPVSGDRAMSARIEKKDGYLVSYVQRSGRSIFEYNLDFITKEYAITRNISYPQDINFRISKEGKVLGIAALGTNYLKSSGNNPFSEEISPQKKIFFVHPTYTNVDWKYKNNREVFALSGITGVVGNAGDVSSFKLDVKPEDIIYESYNNNFWEKYIYNNTLYMECSKTGKRVILKLGLDSKNFREDFQEILLPLLESFTLY